ncbi:hypothetical protein FHX34_10373 [Actinoplanes teichomyceticus]|uniref:Uncharacterized protein n=1 Tax=Actinoplanes teichomyceticus TaxID=1867 RepID=A0A561W9J7_ACTTI|nr:hypothetical protein [Actinoplanes teichomyceticus]TWG20545.1 hypothetical protein FHX34_10373 [Actinoplanes teichomyceticus]
MTIAPEPRTAPIGLPDTGPRAPTESVGTVILAGLANLAIAAAKLVAGLLSGSAAMLPRPRTRSPTR